MSRGTMEINPIFSIVAHVRGQYNCSFVFVGKDEFSVFKKTLYKELEQQYGPLTIHLDSLPKLQVGDYCLCSGEGNDILKIEGIKQFSPYRWGFALSHGCWEEVAKCYEKVNKD